MGNSRVLEHKIRNVVGHLTEEYQSAIRCKMRNAYAMREYADAKRGLDALLRELMDLNPSAAHSLEEGMEETLAVHRLRLPEKLRQTLRSTNPIESAFDTVETVCRNVKRWQGGDQYLRWVASGLLWVESRWNRIHGYRELPILVKDSNSQSSKPSLLVTRAWDDWDGPPSLFQLKSGHLRFHHCRSTNIIALLPII